MKYIISETQYKKIINEDRFFQLSNSSDILEKIINNFDSMDCNNKESFSKTYVRVFCEQLQGASLDKLIRMKEVMDKEIRIIIHDEFSDKFRNRF